MATTLTTIDVSKCQDPEKIDWDGLKKRGLKSIIIQLSHGTSYEPNAKEFIAKAKSLGLKIHGYHFYEGSLSEIAFSYQNAEKLGLDKGAYMFLDMEGSISGDWQTQFYSFRSAWLQAGFHVGLYISESPYKAKFDNTKLVQDNVYRWIADYSHEPANYDIWQYSSSNGTLDVSYDRSGKLEQDYQPHEVYPVKPDDNKGKGKQNFEPGPRNPMTPKDGSWVGWGVDSSGLGGGKTLGYSTDGKNFYAAIWPGGFVFRQKDADQMWELIKNKIKFPDTKEKIEWANILDKPDLVTQEDLKKIELTPGPQGKPGKDGAPGKDGKNGQPGRDGIDGKSAYQIWLDNGHSGTETDFLNSLKGAKGDPGKDGQNGTPGTNGKNGADGKSAYQIWLDNGHTGTETDFLNSLKGKDGTDVDLSGYATTEAVQKAQSTADNAYKYSQNEASLINKRIDNIKVPTESDFNRVKTVTSGTLAGLASAQGSYHYEIDFVPSDGPASDWGLLDVVVGEHYAKQVFTNTGATGDNLRNVYIRTRGYGSTSWSDWHEITLWQ